MEHLPLPQMRLAISLLLNVGGLVELVVQVIILQQGLVRVAVVVLMLGIIM